MSTLTLLNGVGAVLGLVVTLAVARLFGTAREIEVFFAASTLLTLLGSLTQTGQLGEIVLPVYHQVRSREGEASAHRAFAAVLNWTLLLGGAVTLVLWAAAPILILLLVPGFEAADRELATAMFRVLLPLLVGQTAVALLGTLGNAERQFGRPEGVAVGAQFLSLVSIVALAPRLGAWAMVVSMWVAQAVQLVGLASLLHRARYRHRLCVRHPGIRLRTMFGHLGYTAWYTGATQFYLFGLNAGVSVLPQGAYAVYSYALKLFSRTNGVLLRPVSIVFFTHVSEAVAAGASDLRALARTAVSRSLAMWAAAMVCVVVAGRPLLWVLWGGDRFPRENVEMAYHLLVALYVMLLAMALSQIARKMAMALGAVRQQYLTAAVVQALSGMAAWVVIPRVGFPGVAVVMGFNAVATAAVSMLVLQRVRSGTPFFYPLPALWRWIAAGLGGVAAGLALAAYLGEVSGKAALLLQAGGASGVALATMLVVGRSLGIPEIVAGGSWLASLRRARPRTSEARE